MGMGIDHQSTSIQWILIFEEIGKKILTKSAATTCIPSTIMKSSTTVNSSQLICSCYNDYCKILVVL